jgi:maltokinase
MPESLARRVEQVPPRLLLPHGSAAPDRMWVVDALPLPHTVPQAWLVLTRDDAGAYRALPVVDDGQQPRRSRPGDGWMAALVAASAYADDLDGWQVRVVDAPDPDELRGALTEEPVSASWNSEVVDVAGRYRVRLVLRPETLSAPSIQPWRHLAHTAADLVAGGRFDITWHSNDLGAVAPVALVATPDDRPNLAEMLNREVTGHLRGRDTADRTLQLATALGEVLARLHHAFATPSAEQLEPVTFLSAEDVALLDRRVKDVLSEALVLTDEDVRDTLRAHLADLRSSFGELGRADGASVLPAVPVGNLEQFLVADDRLVVDVLRVQPVEGPHLAVMDVAHVLREVTHVAHGALRRMVSGGEDVPAERVPTWVGAVRETVLERYEATLAAYGQAALFDRRLLRAFEIEAECQALIYASRELPTWSSVPDAGLVELLSPW